MLRRLVLRRGLTALLGGAVTLAAGSNRANLAPPLPAGMPGPAGDDAAYDKRRTYASPLNKQVRALERQQWMKHRARTETDQDLLALGSVSAAWRASVMMDRLEKRQAPLDALYNRINAIWEEPVERLQTLVASWIRGDA